MKRGALFTLPNSISLSRLILALAFVLMDGRWERTILIIAAGVTDILDGWLARIGNSSTVAGALIDPFADRVFVLTAVSAYLVNGLLSTPQFFIFLARDIATAIGFIVARFIPGLGASAFKARALGKTVTVFQLVTLVAVLHLPQLITPLIAIIAMLSAVSIVDYTLALSRERVRARQASR
jgi:CDP-diacylglycerol--glycerol-3-phosphate 3-phosphatidyltransferase/cardiolipin synthase